MPSSSCAEGKGRFDAVYDRPVVALVLVTALMRRFAVREACISRNYLVHVRVRLAIAVQYRTTSAASCTGSGKVHLATGKTRP